MEVLLVNVSTFHPKADDTCILWPQDYPSFINRKSFIEYQYASIKKTEDLEIEIAHNDSKIHGIITEKVLSRICQGLRLSPDTEPDILEFYEKASKTESTRQDSRG